MDIIVTIPKSITWSDYEKELKEVEDFTSVMNFKTPHFPKTSAGEKCYLVYNGYMIETVGMSCGQSKNIIFFFRNFD